MDAGSDEEPQESPREAGWRGVKDDDEDEDADHALQFGFSPEDEDEEEEGIGHGDVAAALQAGCPEHLALDRHRRRPDRVGCDGDAAPLSTTPPGQERPSPPLLSVFADDKPVPRDVADNDPNALVVRLDEDYVAPTQILEGSPPALTSDAEAHKQVMTFPPVVKKTSEEDFEQLRLLGRGGYGKVILVRHRQTCRVHAMKVLKKASIAIHRKDREHTLTERQVLAAINHPFIVPLYYAFQCDQKLYLILKYASGGELFTHMSNEKMFEEDVAAFYAAEIASALEHLHGLGIIYRDLKPENVLLDDEGHVLVTDFGLSKTGLLEYGESGRTGTVCGTIEYMAPEVVLEHQYDKAVDWWSFGVLIFDMLTGSPPFAGNSRKAIMDNILKKKIVMPPYLTPDARDLITKLLRRNPAQRIGSSPPAAPAAAPANSLPPDSPGSSQRGRPGRRGRGRQQSDQSRSRSSSPFVSKGQPSVIRAHRFFRKIDWDKLIRRELEPPIRPIVLADDDVSNFDSKFTSVPLTNTPPKSSVSEMERQLLAANLRYVKRDHDSSTPSSPPVVDAASTIQSLPASGASTPKAPATPSATGSPRPIPIRTPVAQKQNDAWQKLTACPDPPPRSAEPGASVDDETLLEKARTLSRSYRSLFKGFSWVAPSLLVDEEKNGEVGTQ